MDGSWQVTSACGLQEFANVELISPEDPDLSTAMTSFHWKGRGCDEVFRHLMDHHLRCRPVREQGMDAIRVSTHLFNTLAEVDMLADSLAKL